MTFPGILAKEGAPTEFLLFSKYSWKRHVHIVYISCTYR